LPCNYYGVLTMIDRGQAAVNKVFKLWTCPVCCHYNNHSTTSCSKCFSFRNDFLSNNDLRILQVLLANQKGLTRSDICHRAAIAWTTVYDSLVRLMRRHFVENKRIKIITGKGRPRVFYFPLVDEISKNFPELVGVEWKK